MDEEMETAAALVRSRARMKILRRLADSSATRYELRDALDCSRTTVDRNLDQLVADGWITSTESGYAITTSGRVVLGQSKTFLETVSVATRLQPLLRHVSRTDLDVDLRHLGDADLTVAAEATPLAMVDKHTESIKHCSSFRSVLPVTSAQPFEVQYRQIMADELTVELIVTPEIAEVFTTDPQFTEMTGELLDTDAFTLYVTDQSVPYYLGVLDDTVQIGVDEDQQPRALLESDNQAVREWAEAKIEVFREAATPFATWRAE